MAMLTIVPMLGFAGVVFAVAGNNQGATLATPTNDTCSTATSIPDGPYPVLMAAEDISDATPQGSDDPDVCTANGVDYTVWFSFAPSVSGKYVFSTCAGNGATGSTVYDTVLGLFTACSGTTLVCNDSAVGCVPDVPGAPYVDQSTGEADLIAGQTYYVSVGHWSRDVGGITAGFNQIALTIDLSPAPPNDTCSSPTPLGLDRITYGTTASAMNDYRSPTSCFTGYGQIPTTSSGVDVVFSFVPPGDDTYSFRYVQDDSSAALQSQSPVLYLATTCPAPTNSANPISGCIAGANRMNDQTTGNDNRAEEINCVPLTGGTPYYLFFDDRFAGNAGGPLAVEVTRCRRETESNDAPATATPYVPNSGCFMEGTSAPSGSTGDVDFYDLGAPPAGSKIFAAIDAAAANQSDFEMRITTGTDTIGYDHDDGTSWVGSNAPIVAGPIAPGGEIYARIDSVPAVTGNEPYSFFARIETGAAQAEDLLDITPSGPPDFNTAITVTGGGFVKGTMSTANDMDCFEFVAYEGDDIVAFSDNNPDRAAGTITNVWPELVTLDGAPPSNTLLGGQVLRNIDPNTPSSGLAGVTPSVTSEFQHYRARYTGAYMICYTPTSDINNATNPPASDYPLPYAGSISLTCGPIPVPTSGAVSITKTGPVGTARTGDLVDYTITLTNTDPAAIAQNVRLVDNLPPELVFVGLAVDDGFGGNDTGCLSLPTPGANDAPVDCTNFSIAPGASVTYTLSVQVGNCIGAGLDVVNTASITTFTPDNDPANDSASWTFTTSEDGSCNTLLCDAGGCIHNACLVGNTCDVNHVCLSEPPNCDDNNVCTNDSCDPTNSLGHPCINDSSQLGDLCSDGNACTLDRCDPLLFCIFPPAPAGTTCDDFQFCTLNDVCDGAGVCVGHSICDDGNPCTDDFCDELNNLACAHTPNDTNPCDDGDACTTGDTCGGGHCNPGGPTNCDDGNCCTNDGCNPSSGCFHTANTAPPVFVNQPTLGTCALLWPPQHGYVDFTVANTSAAATSQCGIASIGFGSCHSSQPENGNGVGDGNSIRDCVYTPGTLSLRAERDGACSPLGRVYSSTVVATDICGNIATSDPFNVYVWHDRGHGPNIPYLSANPGSNQNDQRPLGFNSPANYGTGCGPGIPAVCDVVGQPHDGSDADPEMEISQQASISVGDLHLDKATGGHIKLTWTEPAHQATINVTRFHVYRLDPVTMFWTQIAEVTKQTHSYLDAVLNDGNSWQYKVTAMIK